MSLVDIEAAIARIRRHATIDCVEPAAAYSLAEHNGLTVARSGDVAFPPDLAGEGEGNLVLFGAGAETKKMRTMRLRGSRNIVYFGPHTRVSFITLDIVGDDNFIYVGSFTSANRLYVTRYANGTATVIGDRSMLSNNIHIGRADPVGFFETESGRSFDPAGDIVCGEYCWLGRNSVIEPGAVVGRHSVVAQAAFVVGDHPPNSILAGIPAVVRRRGVVWARTNEETFDATLQAPHAVQLFQRPLAKLRAKIAALDPPAPAGNEPPPPAS